MLPALLQNELHPVLDHFLSAVHSITSNFTRKSHKSLVTQSFTRLSFLFTQPFSVFSPDCEVTHCFCLGIQGLLLVLACLRQGGAPPQLMMGRGDYIGTPHLRMQKNKNKTKKKQTMPPMPLPPTQQCHSGRPPLLSIPKTTTNQHKQDCAYGAGLYTHTDTKTSYSYQNTLGITHCSLSVPHKTKQSRNSSGSTNILFEHHKKDNSILVEFRHKQDVSAFTHRLNPNILGLNLHQSFN